MINLIGMWQDWRERREILRDIRRRKRDMEESERFRFRDAMMEALSALRRDDHERAARIWKEAAERCPGEVTRSTLALDPTFLPSTKIMFLINYLHDRF